MTALTQDKTCKKRLRLVVQAMCLSGVIGGCSSIAPLMPPANLVTPKPVLDSGLSVSRSMRAECASNATTRAPDCSVSSHATNDTATCAYAGCLDSAIKYGMQWQEHYYQSAHQDVAFRNLLPLPILPFSAIAVYRGTGVPPQPRLAQGYALAAASLYAGSQYLNAPDRPKIFLEGSGALTCVLGKARTVARLGEDFQAARRAHANLVAHLGAAQAEYRKFRRSPPVLELLAMDDEAYAVAHKYIFERFESRLEYYEHVASTVGRALEELDNSGDELRTLIDLIVNATATELLKAQPDIAALKIAVGDLPKLAASLGKVAELPAPPSPVPTAPAPASAPPDAPLAARGLPPAVVGAPDLPKAIAATRASSATAGAPELVPVAVSMVGQNRILIPRLMHAAVPLAKKKEAVPTEAKKPSPSNAAANQQVLAVETLVKLLTENTGNIEFNVDASGLTIAGKLVRPKSPAELAAGAAQRVANKAIEDSAKVIADNRRLDLVAKVKKQILHAPEFVAANTPLLAVAETSETARLMVASWFKSSPATVAGCDDADHSSGSAGAIFRVTPRLDSKVLVVDEPMVFIVANSRVLPNVQLAGENTQSIGIETTIVGDEFHVTVKAQKAIPADKHPTLIIGGYTGRVVRITLTAKVKEKAAS